MYGEKRMKLLGGLLLASGALALGAAVCRVWAGKRRGSR